MRGLDILGFGVQLVWGLDAAQFRAELNFLQRDTKKAFGEINSIADKKGDELQRILESKAKKYRQVMLGAWSAVGAAYIVKGWGDALVQPFKSALAVGKDYETQLIRLGFVANQTKAQLRDLDTFITRTSLRTIFGPTELARGIRELVQTGISLKKAKDSIGPLGDFVVASGGEVSMGEAAKNLGVAMLKFKQTKESAADILDMYTAATVASPLDFRDFGILQNSLRDFSIRTNSTAAETFAFSAILSQTGLTAAEVGNHVVNLTRRLDTLQRVQARMGVPANGASLGGDKKGNYILAMKQAMMGEMPGEAFSAERGDMEKKIAEVLANSQKRQGFALAAKRLLAINTYDKGQPRPIGAFAYDLVKNIETLKTYRGAKGDQDPLSQQNINMLIGAVFGAQGQTIASALTSFTNEAFKKVGEPLVRGSAAIKQFLVWMEKSKGKLAEFAADQRRSWEGVSKLWASSVEALQKTIAFMIYGPVKLLTTGATKVLNVFIELVKATGTFGQVVLGLAGSLGLLLKVVGGLALTLSQVAILVTTGGMFLFMMMAQYQVTSITALVSKLRFEFAILWKEIGAAGSFLSKFIVRSLVGLALFAGAISLVVSAYQKNWGGLKDSVDGVLKNIKLVSSAVRTMWDDSTISFGRYIELQQAGLWGIVTKIIDMKFYVTEFFSGLVHGADDGFQRVGRALLFLWEGPIRSIGLFIVDLIEGIGNAATYGAHATTYWGLQWSRIGHAVGQIMTPISYILSTVIHVVGYFAWLVSGFLRLRPVVFAISIALKTWVTYFIIIKSLSLAVSVYTGAIAMANKVITTLSRIRSVIDGTAAQNRIANMNKELTKQWSLHMQAMRAIKLEEMSKVRADERVYAHRKMLQTLAYQRTQEDIRMYYGATPGSKKVGIGGAVGGLASVLSWLSIIAMAAYGIWEVGKWTYHAIKKDTADRDNTPTGFQTKRSIIDRRIGGAAGYASWLALPMFGALAPGVGALTQSGLTSHFEGFGSTGPDWRQASDLSRGEKNYLTIASSLTPKGRSSDKKAAEGIAKNLISGYDMMSESERERAKFDYIESNRSFLTETTKLKYNLSSFTTEYVQSLRESALAAGKFSDALDAPTKRLMQKETAKLIGDKLSTRSGQAMLRDIASQIKVNSLSDPNLKTTDPKGFAQAVSTQANLQNALVAFAEDMVINQGTPSKGMVKKLAAYPGALEAFTKTFYGFADMQIAARAAVNTVGEGADVQFPYKRRSALTDPATPEEGTSWITRRMLGGQYTKAGRAPQTAAEMVSLALTVPQNLTVNLGTLPGNEAAVIAWWNANIGLFAMPLLTFLEQRG